jgi:hypothetical protein
VPQQATAPLIPGGSSMCWTSLPAARAPALSRARPLARGTPASCSTRAPKRHTAGGSPRSKKTSKRPGRSSWPARSAWAAAIGAPGRRRNAPGAQSPGRSATPWPGSASMKRYSADRSARGRLSSATVDPLRVSTAL